MKVYLASPWFKNNERVMYTQILQKMRAEGHEVYAPVEHEIPNAWDLSNAEWGRQVFFADIKAIDECEEVWVLNFGMYSDTGTAWECGYAYAKGKTVRQLVYDFTADKVFSLMMINGCEEYDSMCNYLFNRDDEIRIEQKQGLTKPQLSAIIKSQKRKRGSKNG